MRGRNKYSKVLYLLLFYHIKKCKIITDINFISYSMISDFDDGMQKKWKSDEGR